VGKKSHLFHWK